RHPLPFDNSRRVGSRSDRPGLPVPRVAVGFRTAAEIMAVQDGLGPAGVAGTGDFHEVAGGEDRYGYGVTRLGRLFALRRSSDREALEHPRRGLEARLLGVTRERLGRARGLLPLEA